MNNQVTFNSNGSANPNQFPSLSKQPPEGTSRFGEPEPRNKSPQSELVQQLTGSKVESKQKSQDFTVRSKGSAGDEQPYQRTTCPEHPDRLVENVCVKVGCTRPNPLLCLDCSENHQCDQLVPYGQFVNVLNARFDSQNVRVYQDLDSMKREVDMDIQAFHIQLIKQLQQVMQQLEALMLRRVIVEGNYKLELKGSFLQSIVRTDFYKLNLKRDYQQLTPDEAIVVKLIYNDFFSISDLHRVFLKDRDLMQRKLIELKEELSNLQANYLYHIEDIVTNYTDIQLSGVSKPVYETQFKMTRSDQSTLQQKQNLEKILVNVVNDRLQQMKQVQTLNAHQGSQIIDFCELSNSLIASASDKGDIIVWKVPFYSEVCRFQHGIECTSLAHCVDEIKQKFLVSAGRTSQEYQIYLWNIDLRTKVTEVTGHNHPLRKVIPLTKCRLAWCAQDQMVRLWNLKERVQENEIKIHSAWINDLCRLSDNLVASCSRDHTVAVFDVDTGKPKYVIKDETYVTCLCLVTQESYAYGNYNGWIKIYQTEFPVKLWELRINTNWLEANCIWAISRISDTFIATSSTNGKLAIVSLERKKDQIIREIEITLSKVSETLLWHNDQFLSSQNQMIKIFQ